MLKSDFRIVSDADDDLSSAVCPLLDDAPDFISDSLRIVIPVTEIDIPQHLIVSFDLSLKFTLIHRVDSWNGIGRNVFG